MALLEDLATIPWRTILPEVVWIGLLHGKLGDARAAEVMVDVVRAASAVPVADGEHGPIPGVGASWFGGLSLEDQQTLLDGLSDGVKGDVREALTPLVSLYPSCPFAFLCAGDDEADAPEAISLLKPVLERLLDRRSREATLCQMSALYALGVNRRLLFPPEAKETVETLRSIEAYPNTEQSRAAGSIVRALTTAVFGFAPAAEWPKEFWRLGIELEPCEYMPFEELGQDTKDFFVRLEKAAKGLAAALPAELESVWRQLDPHLEDPLRGEALGGLIARVHRLLSTMLRNPQLWSSDLARVVLRCMLDTFLTLRQLVEANDPRLLRKYVEHGLGQEKLYLEHLRVRIREDGRGDLRELADEVEEWINAQLITPLVPVDIGAWNNVRETANALSEDDLYDLHFTPYSSVVHGSWNAVSRFDLDICMNPLHGIHRTPNFGPQGLDARLLLSAVDLFEAGLDSFLDGMGSDSVTLECLAAFDSAIDQAVGSVDAPDPPAAVQ